MEKCYVVEQTSEYLEIGLVFAAGLLCEQVERTGCRDGSVVHVGHLDVEGCEYLHDCSVKVECKAFGRRGECGDAVGYGSECLDCFVGLAVGHHLGTVDAQVVICGVEVGFL